MDSAKHTGVVIIGGGPTGCAAAITLKKQRPQCRVQLIEKSHYQHFRIGETLPPGCDTLLRQLGIWQAFAQQSHLPSYGTRAAWGSSELHDNEFIFNVNSKGWHLDRQAFDAFLLDQAKRLGVIVTLDTNFSPESLHQPFRDTLDEQHLEQFVIDASGRHCVYARAQGAQRQYDDRLMATYALFPCNNTQDTATLVEASENGWWYSVLLPDNQRLISFMTDADFLKKQHLKSVDSWMANLATSQHTRSRINTRLPPSTITSCAADSAMLDKAAGSNWLAAGDAVSTFDPLSSQGIFKSLRSGIYAAYATLNQLDGEPRGIEKYCWLVAQEYQDYLTQRRHFYSLEKRWPEAPFWQRRGTY